MLMCNAGIIHYVLFWNESNGLQCAYFVNNVLQTTKRFYEQTFFLNIIHKMVQILQQKFLGRFRE